MTALYSDAKRRLDRRVHALYLEVDGEVPVGDDGDFVHLHGLRVECDPECNRLLRILRAYEMRHPEAA